VPTNWRAFQLAEPQTKAWLLALEGDLMITRAALGPFFHYMQMNQMVLHVHLPVHKGFQEGPQLPVIVPLSMTKWMLKEAHNSKIVGHMGVFKMAKKIRE
jgi:hypothetical protein